MRRFKSLRYIALFTLIFVNIGVITLVKSQHMEKIQTIQIKEEAVPGGRFVKEESSKALAPDIQNNNKFKLNGIGCYVAIIIVLIVFII